MTHGNREIEIKLRVPDAGRARRLLRAAGFRISKPRVFESNTLFDTPEQRLRQAGLMLRVRNVNGAGKLTYKGPASAGKHKIREELEIDASKPLMLAAILEKLGFTPAFRYEKFRTEFRRDPGGEATLDETPIGVFLELEGTPGWIDCTARSLGFAEGDYVTASYAALYLDWCLQRRRAPRNMVFATTAARVSAAISKPRPTPASG
jgi:adenylate cyclase class 2